MLVEDKSIFYLGTFFLPIGCASGLMADGDGFLMCGCAWNVDLDAACAACNVEIDDRSILPSALFFLCC